MSTTGRSQRTGWRTAQIVGEREALALAATLGGQVREGRRAKRWTQQQLGDRVGLKQSRISKIERTGGAGAPLGTWIALGIALDRPFAGSFSRPMTPQPADAGHLGAQELILRLARANGIPGTFELPTRPSNPGRSIDVGLRDDRRRVLSVIEIWNRIDDLGQMSRDHHRKMAEAEGLAAALGRDEGPYRVAACWVLRATAANRELVRRYPTIFAANFPGSSRLWVRALAEGLESPMQPGSSGWTSPAPD